MMFIVVLLSVWKNMTDSQGEVTPLELYEKLNVQGEKVRSLKTAKAEKVSNLIFQFMALSQHQ